MPISIEALEFFDYNNYWEYKNWSANVENSLSPYLTTTPFSEILTSIVLAVDLLDLLKASNFLESFCFFSEIIVSFLHENTWVNLELLNLDAVVTNVIGQSHDNLNVSQ